MIQVPDVLAVETMNEFGLELVFDVEASVKKLG